MKDLALVEFVVIAMKIVALKELIGFGPPHKERHQRNCKVASLLLASVPDPFSKSLGDVGGPGKTRVPPHHVMICFVLCCCCTRDFRALLIRLGDGSFLPKKPPTAKQFPTPFTSVRFANPPRSFLLLIPSLSWPVEKQFERARDDPRED